MKRFLCALAALLVRAVAQAAAPGLEIDSLPVTAACPQQRADGPLLLRPASPAGAAELYRADAVTGDWGGHFSRYVLPAGATASGAGSVLAWDAGARLSGGGSRMPMPAPAQRQIYTAIVQPGGALQMVPFVWSALSAQQQALLDGADHAGPLRVAYLRGDRAQEGRLFRTRSSVLGDAVHGTPVYVAHAGQRAAVYLGANDGMLHGFDVADGSELFAYVPDALMASLRYLSDPGYTHRAYVDGPALAATVRLGERDRTFLLSAMGGGARGVFALDVSNPMQVAAVWEFTGRDDPLMGNVTTTPQLAKVRVRKDVYRYFAVVAGGVNGDDGRGALFLLALDKPPGEGWRRNDNYYRIATPVADAQLANGLSAPALLNDSAGALRYAYAGDLQGNLWRIDFSGDAPWPDAASPPLFVARDDSGLRQPIAEQPALAYAQLRGYVVLFGTGRLIERADRSSARTAVQSYYGIVDSLQTPPDAIPGRRQLTPRYLDGDGALLSIAGMRMEAGSKGWYVDFAQAGERSVQAGLVVDGALLFNTVQPGTTMCSVTRGRSYALNVLTGLADDGPFSARLPGNEALVGLLLPGYQPMPLWLPQAVTRGARDAQGRIRQEKAYALVGSDAQGQARSIASLSTVRRAGRLSWREIANWRELHEDAK